MIFRNRHQLQPLFNFIVQGGSSAHPGVKRKTLKINAFSASNSYQKGNMLRQVHLPPPLNNFKNNFKINL